MICHKEKDEPLTCPLKSKRKDIDSGYASLPENLMELNKPGQLPMPLERLDEGEGIEMAMIANNADIISLVDSNITIQSCGELRKEC